MQYYELLVTIMLNNDIPYKESFEKLSNMINIAMIQDKYLAALHKRIGYKFYTFSSFYPVKSIYKKGDLYTFRVRSIDYDFIKKLKTALRKIQVFDICIISSEIIYKQQKFINELVTLTPVVVTLKCGKYWSIGSEFDSLKQAIHNNIQRKYQTYFNKTLGEYKLFFNGIQILNSVPYVVPYKTGKLIGTKLKLQINTDETSQKLATMCLSSGLGEKNSIGMGFCFAD